MVVFNDLPIEILPLILDNIAKPSHLVNVCLVNRTFDAFGRGLLYHKVFIYSWHKNVKTKVRARYGELRIDMTMFFRILLGCQAIQDSCIVSTSGKIRSRVE